MLLAIVVFPCSSKIFDWWAKSMNEIRSARTHLERENHIELVGLDPWDTDRLQPSKPLSQQWFDHTSAWFLLGFSSCVLMSRLLCNSIQPHRRRGLKGDQADVMISNVIDLVLHFLSLVHDTTEASLYLSTFPRLLSQDYSYASCQGYG